MHNNLDAIRGDTNVYDVEVLRFNAPVDITGARFWFTAKLELSDSDGNAVVQKDSHATNDFSIVDDVGGKARLILQPSDLNSLLTDKTLYYDIQMKEGDGQISTIAEGLLKVKSDITRAS